jgi:hypothetical protein
MNLAPILAVPDKFLRSKPKSPWQVISNSPWELAREKASEMIDVLRHPERVDSRPGAMTTTSMHLYLALTKAKMSNLYSSEVHK